MRILKILFIAFLIYFIRRIIQLFQGMKKVQEGQNSTRKEKVKPQEGVIDADFKVMD